MSAYSCKMVMAIARSGLVVAAAAVAATGCMSSSGDDGPGGDDDTCGNHVCDPGESMSSCPEDCHAVGSGSGSGETCGNHMCDAGETTASCPQDCPAPPPAPVCGNRVCEAGETQTSCPADCTATLVTVNSSTHTINTVHVHACTDPSEGPNWLGTNLLGPGFRFTLDHIPPGCYLFDAASGDGFTWHTQTGVSLVAAELFTWTLF